MLFKYVIKKLFLSVTHFSLFFSQCVFTSLAYLFKFLWRHMIKDIENVFKMHSELLGLSVQTHIRQFAVESFGFLLRKVSQIFFGIIIFILLPLIAGA